MSEENKAVIRRLIDEVWNRRAFDVADELFAPEAIIYESGVALPGAGPAVVKEGIGAICPAQPDIRTTIDDMIAADDKVVVRWSSIGTHQGVMQGIAPSKGCSKRHRNLSIRCWQSCRGMDEYRSAGHPETVGCCSVRYESGPLFDQISLSNK